MNRCWDTYEYMHSGYQLCLLTWNKLFGNISIIFCPHDVLLGAVTIYEVADWWQLSGILMLESPLMSEDKAQYARGKKLSWRYSFPIVYPRSAALRKCHVKIYVIYRDFLTWLLICNRQPIWSQVRKFKSTWISKTTIWAPVFTHACC